MITFSVSRTFDDYWFIGDSGDYKDEHGFVYEQQDKDLRATVKELRECSELSGGPVRGPQDVYPGMWANTEARQDYHNGSDHTESVHVFAMNGRVISNQNLFRLFKLAGLVR